MLLFSSSFHLLESASLGKQGSEVQHYVKIATIKTNSEIDFK